MEQVSFVNGMLDKVSKIINFFNIGYKKDGIVEFKGIEKNLEELKKKRRRKVHKLSLSKKSKFTINTWTIEPDFTTKLKKLDQKRNR
jgi:hypothetical protein